ncbi:hypothetical protein BC628DRAFT_374701 [Trametes gibbosa]|nr:hypothetical protein BC628DRAFT_374701 [Trametes gibbosa]
MVLLLEPTGCIYRSASIKCQTVVNAPPHPLATPTDHYTVDPRCIANANWMSNGTKRCWRHCSQPMLRRSPLSMEAKPVQEGVLLLALKLYEEGRVELVDVLSRIMIMCAHAPSLLQQLNYFLPSGYAFNISMLSMESKVVVLHTPNETLQLAASS